MSTNIIHIVLNVIKLHSLKAGYSAAFV